MEDVLLRDGYGMGESVTGQIICRDQLSEGGKYDRRLGEDLRIPCGRHAEYGLPHHGQSESRRASEGGV